MKILILATVVLTGTRLVAGQANEAMEQQFPYKINCEIGDSSGFYDGNEFAITTVLGDRPHIEPGGSYLVEGTYKLASQDKSQLSLYCTTRGPSGPTPVQDGQQFDISRGSGRFFLCETNIPDGWLHVCFSSMHGNVYFGDKGVERTVLRNHKWKEISLTDLAEKNAALVLFLGEPVPVPKNLDNKYTKEGLVNAVQLGARNAGVTLNKLEIDDSEFPFLVGVICRESDAVRVKAELKKMDGYAYGGGIGDDRSDSDKISCQVFCIVPIDACPTEKRQQVFRRRMIREQVFFERLSAQE